MILNLYMIHESQDSESEFLLSFACLTNCNQIKMLYILRKMELYLKFSDLLLLQSNAPF